MKGVIYSFIKRFAILILLIAGVVFIVVWMPYFSAARVAKGQYKQTEALQNKLGIALNAIKGVPPFMNEVGYRDQLRDYSEKVSGASIKSIPKLNTNAAANKRFKLVRSVNKIITDYNLAEAYKKAEDALSRADALLAYQAATAKALASIMQYNPGVDTKDFKLGSADTKDRLDGAEEGLARAKIRINEAKNLGYTDPALGEIENLIDDLEKERAVLAGSGDTPRWISKFQEIRGKIISNRHDFWVKESSLKNTELTSSYDHITSIVRRWLRLTYNS